jgi:hypothetical protein
VPLPSSAPTCATTFSTARGEIIFFAAIAAPFHSTSKPIHE